MKESAEYYERSDTAPRFGKVLAKSALRELGLKPSQFVVVGGMSLLLRGLRDDVGDVDLLVDARTFDGLRSRPDITSYNVNGEDSSFYGASNSTVHIETGAGVPISATTHMNGQGRYELNFATIKTTQDVIERIPCISLDEQVASKLALRRPKDISDLISIQNRYPDLDLSIPRPLADPNADIY